MMRAIKFKAYLKNTKKIVDVEKIDFKNKQIYFYEKSDGYLYVGNFKDLKLMQFTGLYDKNGKEIYENDVVKNYLPYLTFIGLVFYKNGSFQLKGHYENDQESILYYLSEYTEKEVIGNIFENKEI